MSQDLPRYRELPESKESKPWRSGWGVFGKSSQLGTLELLTPSRRLHALSLAKEGVSINLDHPLNIPLSIFKHRRRFTHNVFEILPGYYDETLDDFAPQLSSQWDGLRHVKAADGFYNDLLPAGGETSEGGPLGIDQVAVHGIIGRGVLLDVERYLRDTDQAIEPNRRREIPTGLLDEVADAQHVSIEPGDILLVRFGVDSYIRDLTNGVALEDMRYEAPGLQQDESTIEWLWDKHVAAICADNIAIEVTPPRGEGTRIHPALLGLLGLTMGELFDLSELSHECAERNRYEFLFIAKPIRLPGGVGSPANAMAVF